MTNEDFKQKFSDYQENEPQGLWDGILEGLDAAKAPAKPSGRKKRAVIIPLAVTIAAAAAIVLGVFLMPQEQSVVPAIPSGELIADNYPADPVEEPLEPAEPSVPAEPVTPAEPTAPAPLPEAPENEPGAANEQPAAAYAEETTQATEPLEEHSDPISIYSEEFEYNADDDLQKPDRGRKLHRKKSTAIGLLADGIFKSSSSTGGYDGSFEYTTAYSPGTMIQNGLNVDPVRNITNMNSNKEVTTRTAFTIPVRAGLSVRWRLAFGLGFEVGLQYSYINSITESGSTEHFSRTESICHYVGVPFNISYAFWGNEYLDVYINTGLLLELRVDGSSVTRYYVNREHLGNEVEGDPAGPFGQMSAVISVGIQYNILPWLALYAEPGATYFLGENPLYGDRPWNLSIRAGLRFEFRN